MALCGGHLGVRLLASKIHDVKLQCKMTQPLPTLTHIRKCLKTQKLTQVKSKVWHTLPNKPIR